MEIKKYEFKKDEEIISKYLSKEELKQFMEENSPIELLSNYNNSSKSFEYSKHVGTVKSPQAFKDRIQAIKERYVINNLDSSKSKFQ